MNKRRVLASLVVIMVLLRVANQASGQQGGSNPQAALGTSFTYQGQLKDAGGSPVNDTCDLRFSLWNDPAAGAQIGTRDAPGVLVSDGLFTVLLDFGSVFDGTALWLQVAVQCSADPVYVTLSPRQALTAAPYALNAHLLDGQHASAFSNAAHTHLGETWTGNDNSLTITGSFSGGQGAPLVLGNSNSSGKGLRIVEGGDAGVSIAAANYGVVVQTADTDGLDVESAGDDGVQVNWAGDDGIYVDSAGDDGIRINSTGDDGIYIDSAGAHGVYINSAAGDGVHVTSAGGDGVTATSTDPAYHGARFANSAAGGGGLYTRGGSNTAADLVLGGNNDTSDDGRIVSDPSYAGSDLMLISNDAIQLELDEDNNEAGHFWILNGTNTTVFAVNESGDMTAIGAKAASVNTQDYGQRKLYAVESPEVWFEDFGSAQLVDGAATVAIEPIFAQTVNLTEAYHVYLTALCDEPVLLFVTEKDQATFTVQGAGLDGRPSQCAFDYRLVARRLGYEGVRLEAAGSDLNSGEGAP